MNYRHDLTSRLLKNYVSIRFFNSYPSSTMPSECLIRLINRVYIEHQQINRDGKLSSCIEYLNPFNDNFESCTCMYLKKETVKKNRIMEYPNRQRYFHRNRCCFHIVCRFQKKKKKKLSSRHRWLMESGVHGDVHERTKLYRERSYFIFYLLQVVTRIVLRTEETRNDIYIYCWQLSNWFQLKLMTT